MKKSWWFLICEFIFIILSFIFIWDGAPIQCLIWFFVMGSFMCFKAIQTAMKEEKEK